MSKSLDFSGDMIKYRKDIVRNARKLQVLMFEEFEVRSGLKLRL